MVVIPIEVKSRGMIARLKIAQYLVEHNIEVIVGSERSLLYLIQDLKGPFVYFDKSISKNKRDLYSSLKSQGCLICSIDEEGLSVVSNSKGYIQNRFSETMLSLVDRVFFWGKIDYDPIFSAYPLFRDKYVVTGNARMIENKSIREDEFFVAFMSNFTVNHASGDKNLWTKLKSIGRIENEKDEFNYKELQEKQRSAFRIFVEMIRLVLVRYPNKKFIIRPHPSEDQKFWNEMKREFMNLEVDEGHLSAVETIKKSEMMIHMGCTTGLESVLNGTPTIAYLPENHGAKSLSNKVSHEVNNLDDLFDLIGNKSSIVSGIQHLEGEVVSGTEAVENIGKELLKLNSTAISKIELKFHRLRKLKLFIVRLRRYLPIDYGRKERYEYRKFSGMSREEIISVTGFKKGQVKRMAVNIYRIKPAEC